MKPNWLAAEFRCQWRSNDKIANFQTRRRGRNQSQSVDDSSYLYGLPKELAVANQPEHVSGADG